MLQFLLEINGYLIVFFCSLPVQFFCSFSRWNSLKAGLAELERWCCNGTNTVSTSLPCTRFWEFSIYVTQSFACIQYAGSAWDGSILARLAVGLLVGHCCYITLVLITIYITCFVFFPRVPGYSQKNWTIITDENFFNN